MLVPIQVDTSMASPYESLLIRVKLFLGYLVHEIFLWPDKILEEIPTNVKTLSYYEAKKQYKPILLNSQN